MLHIYKKDGYWHILDKKDKSVYNFNSQQDALFAAKYLDSIQNFKIEFGNKLY